MSFFHLPKFSRLLSKRERSRVRGHLHTTRSVRDEAFRLLRLDILEDRRLLSVSVTDPTAQVINSSANLGNTQTTTYDQSTAAAPNGDFVVTYARNDGTNTNIYARYFTNEEERIQLPSNLASGGNFTLSLFGNQGDVQEISITSGNAPGTNGGTTVARGSFGLTFDNVTTAGIGYDQTQNTPATNAQNIQTALQNLYNANPGIAALNGVQVSALDSTDYLVQFAPGYAHQPLLTVGSYNFLGATGQNYLTGILVSDYREPIQLATINVDATAGTGPAHTAQLIQNAFTNIVATTWNDTGSGGNAGSTDTNYEAPVFFNPQNDLSTPYYPTAPYTGTQTTTSSPVQVQVVAENATTFDVTFTGVTGDQDLSYTDSVGNNYSAIRVVQAHDSSGNSYSTSQVQILKKPSAEFLVNDPPVFDTVAQQYVYYNCANPSVAIDDSGEFVITWQEQVPITDHNGQDLTEIFAKRFDPQSLPQYTSLATKINSLDLELTGVSTLDLQLGGQATNDLVIDVAVNNGAAYSTLDLSYDPNNAANLVNPNNPNSLQATLASLPNMSAVTVTYNGKLGNGNDDYTVSCAGDFFTTFSPLGGSPGTFQAGATLEVGVSGTQGSTTTSKDTAPVSYYLYDSNNPSAPTTAFATGLQTALQSFFNGGETVKYNGKLPTGATTGTDDFTVTFAGNSVGTLISAFTMVPVASLGMLYDFVPQAPQASSVTALGNQFQVNQTNINPKQSPSVGMDAQGDFVIGWNTVSQTLGYFNDVLAQRFDLNGNRVGKEFQVNVETTATMGHVKVAMSQDGHIGLAYDQTNDGLAFGVDAQIFDASGNLLLSATNGSVAATGSLFVAGTLSYGASPSISFDANNDFVIGWEGAQDANNTGGTSIGLRAEEFSLAGGFANPILPTFRVESQITDFTTASTIPNKLWSGSQDLMEVAFDANGDLTASYQGSGPAVEEKISVSASEITQYLDETGNSDIAALLSKVPNSTTFSAASGVGSAGNPDEIVNAILTSVELNNPGIDTPGSAAYNPNALGRLRAAMETAVGLMRGDSYAAMFSQFDTSPVLKGNEQTISSDNIASTTRTSTDEQFILDISQLVNGGTFQLAISNPTNGFTGNPANQITAYTAPITVVPNNTTTPTGINISATETNILTALYNLVDGNGNALASGSVIGVNWASATPNPLNGGNEGPVYIRQVTATELAESEKSGSLTTALTSTSSPGYDYVGYPVSGYGSNGVSVGGGGLQNMLTNPGDTVFEITFQDEVQGLAMKMVDYNPGTTGSGNQLTEQKVPCVVDLQIGGTNAVSGNMILTFSGKGANNVAITGVSDVVQIGIVNVTSTVETGTPITVNDAATFAGTLQAQLQAHFGGGGETVTYMGRLNTGGIAAGVDDYEITFGGASAGIYGVSVTYSTKLPNQTPALAVYQGYFESTVVSAVDLQIGGPLSASGTVVLNVAGVSTATVTGATPTYTNQYGKTAIAALTYNANAPGYQNPLPLDAAPENYTQNGVIPPSVTTFQGLLQEYLTQMFGLGVVVNYDGRPTQNETGFVNGASPANYDDYSIYFCGASALDSIASTSVVNGSTVTTTPVYITTNAVFVNATPTTGTPNYVGDIFVTVSPLLSSGSMGVPTGTTTYPYVPDATIVQTQAGTAGVTQGAVSIGMEPSGSFVMTWTQSDGSGTEIEYRRFTESADSVGPIATGVSLGDGTQVINNTQVTESVSALIVSFDEQMDNSPTFNGAPNQDQVTNAANWELLLNGQVVPNAISSIDYGVDESVLDGVRAGNGSTPAVDTNNWEAVIHLTSPLAQGQYQLQALNTLRDVQGNFIGHTAFTPATTYTDNFAVVLPTASETLVNNNSSGTSPAADQPAPGNSSKASLPGATDANPTSPGATAADGNGDYVTVWTTNQNGAQSVWAKIYSVNYGTGANARLGTVTVLSEFQVQASTVTSGWQYTYPSVAEDSQGDFVVTWSGYSPNDTADGWDIYARRYKPSGAPISDAFRVNTSTMGNQKYSTVAMDNQGDFAITWQSNAPAPYGDGSGYGIYAQQYSAQGIPLGGTDAVQQLTFNGTPSGTFQLTLGATTTAPISVNGSTIAAATAIQTALANAYIFADVVATSRSTITVTFVGVDGNLIQPQLAVVNTAFSSPYSSIGVANLVTGSPGEFRVNDTTLNDQTNPDIAMDSSGAFVISWTSAGQNGDTAAQTNVYAKRFVALSANNSGSSAVASVVNQTTQTPVDSYGPEIVSNFETMVANPSVQATAASAGVEPTGQGYDGVAQLTAYRTDLPAGYVGLGSGVLLTLGGGQYVLTAAHMVASDTTGAMVTTSMTVTFNTPTGNVSYTVLPSAIYILPGYTGSPWAGGHDLAILKLPSIAASNIPRYSIYTGSTEVGQTFTKVGYGTWGTGTTGAVNNVDYQKRIGENTYEALASISGNYSDELVFDFEDGAVLGQGGAAAGSPSYDAMYQLYGIQPPNLGNEEIDSAPGDSGGPSFINGQIAGITSYGYLEPGPWNIHQGLTSPDSSFGEFAADVRVSDYASWVEQITQGGGAEILVNTFTTGNQKWSSVAMDSAGDFVVTWTSYAEDGSGNGVFLQRYNAAGANVGTETQVNTFVQNNQQHSSVAMDAAGDFTVAWESFQDRPTPGSGPDSPSSYGIFAQRFVRNSLVSGVNPAGMLGQQFEVNTTLPNDQRFPSVAEDDTGDAVVTWSGYGSQTIQGVSQAANPGIFYQRYDLPSDTAGPVVANTYDLTDGYNSSTGLFNDYNPSTAVITPSSLPTQVVNQSVSTTDISQMLVTFDEPLMTTGGFNGINSVLNPSNWSLSINGVAVAGAVASITPVAAGTPITSAGVKVGTYWANSYVILFNSTPGGSTAAPLGAGQYVLTVSGAVEDVWGNSLDGNYDGLPGGDFHRQFSIVNTAVLQTAMPGPGNPTATATDIPIDTNNDQTAPVVASNSQGAYVVVWTNIQGTGATATTQIMAQRYNQYGVSEGSAFRVDTFTPSASSASNPNQPVGQATVAMDPYGDFTVAWSGAGPGDTYGIFARRYDAFGKAIDTTEFAVNTYTLGTQRSPSVAMDALGDFAVSWTSVGQGGAGTGAEVFVQDFNSAAVAVGNPIELGGTAGGQQDRSDVAMDANGNFTVVWQSNSGQTTGWDIFGQRFNTTAQALGGTFQVNVFSSSNQITPSIAMDSNGDFVVAWASFGQSAPNTYGIYARRFTAAGVAKDAGDIAVNTTTGYRTNPSVSIDSTGDFVVAWQALGEDNAPTQDWGIYARMFHADLSNYTYTDANGNTQTLTGEFRVNATVIGDQITPSVAMDAGGDWVAVWSGPDVVSGVANTTGVYARVVGIVPLSITSVASTLVAPTTSAGVVTTTVGTYNPTLAVFYLKNSNTGGIANAVVAFGPAGNNWIPLSGDWTGDGTETIGLYNPATSMFYLKNTNTSGYPDEAFQFGPVGSTWIPLVGDWNGQGVDTVGLYNPATSTFYLRYTNTAGYANAVVHFGPPGAGWTPIVGDWSGTGEVTVGLYDPRTSTFYLRNSNTSGLADQVIAYGAPNAGWQPVVGDWLGTGQSLIGMYNPTAGTYMLKNSLSGGVADEMFNYGAANQGWKPTVGRWVGGQLQVASITTQSTVDASAATSLTQSELQPIVAAAIERWQEAGATTEQINAMSQVQFHIGNLPNNDVGMEVSQREVYLDATADGIGWFVDSTPATDASFQLSKTDGQLHAVNAQAVDHLDLLTVVEHELGHVIGLADVSSSVDSLMSTGLPEGVRRDATVDALFSTSALDDLG